LVCPLAPQVETSACCLRISTIGYKHHQIHQAALVLVKLLRELSSNWWKASLHHPNEVNLENLYNYLLKIHRICFDADITTRPFNWIISITTQSPKPPMPPLKDSTTSDRTRLRSISPNAMIPANNTNSQTRPMQAPATNLV